jgi:hypothetical protein
MAIHTQLPVYKLCYDLLKLTAELTKNMPRDFKASFGVELRKHCVNTLVLIARANAASDKVPHLSRLLEALHVAELMLRLSHDMRFISPAQFAATVVLTDRIGKQVGGWRKQAAASPVA